MAIQRNLTPAEGEILGVLWEHGPSTVRDVHTALATQRSTGYTTVLKLMQIMLDKGLLERDASQRSHVYSAAVAKDEAQGQAVGVLIDRLFQGSAGQLVLSALDARPASSDELDAIRAYLDAAESKPEARAPQQRSTKKRKKR
jgi:BlaI family transcriptional regulator, penicillinase repressor